jgi:hypothetical protein
MKPCSRNCYRHPVPAAAHNPFAWIGTHAYAYPLLEVLHIVGIAMLLGSLLLLELRVWGFGTALPILALARLALPLTLAGFALAATSGSLMFASQPGDLIANRVFVVKMGLVMMAGLNAASFHARGGVARIDRTARIQTMLSVGIWLAVIFCGRWIAYR